MKMTPQRRLLVVEDEPAIALGLCDSLRAEGYVVELATDGVQAEDLALRKPYDLIVLDIMLPRKDGLALCESLRRSGLRTPIIALTAKAEEADKVAGLECGADDYVTKPFSVLELLARVRALLRRSSEWRTQAECLQCGDLKVDFRRAEASVGDTPISLTSTELRILHALCLHRGDVVTHQELLAAVWGNGVFLSDHVIYTHMNNLRNKIESDPQHPRLVLSVRGIGYRLGG